MSRGELRELLDKATPRPWTLTVDIGNGRSVEDYVFYDASRKRIGSSLKTKNPHYRDDARLIVAAVNALPALLDVVEKARAVVDAFDVDSPSLQALEAALAALDVPGAGGQ